MKYIKLYESLGYEEISRLKSEEIRKNKKELSDKQIEKIKTIVDKLINPDSYGSNSTKLTIFIYKGDIELYISEIGDSYYNVSFHYCNNSIMKYFKCDQIEGLIKCLKFIKYFKV